MIPTTIALVVVQEMASRMGAVTGKGLSDLIREEFGFRVTFFLMLALVVTNFGNVMAEFAGVASSLELFGVSRYIVVPLAAAVVWLLVVKGTYNSVEKIFLVASGFYVCYIVAGVLAHPDWKAATFATVTRPGTGRHPELRISLHADRPRRHDDRAVDAVLPAGVDRRERHHDAAVPRLALGRHHRLPVRRGRRVVHHRRVRGDAALRRTDRDSRRGRRGPGAAPARRRVRVPAVCRRAVQRVALRRVDSADLDVVCRLRGTRLRVGAGQEVPRSAGVLLAVHAADRRRRRRAARSALPARAHHGAVAGRQRRGAAVRPHLHAAADQRPRADGRPRQLARASTSSPGPPSSS